MKNLIKIIIIVTLFFQSCKSDGIVSSQNFNEMRIARIDNNKIVPVFDSKIVITRWENDLKSNSNIEIKFKTVKIIKIRERYYLRAYSNNGYTSTQLLAKKGSSLSMLANSISCTSKSCSNDNGCIPDGATKCTKCWYGDCTKTVTNENQ